MFLKFWPQFLILLATLSAGWWFAHARYQSGYRDASAEWRARLDKAVEYGRYAIEDAGEDARKAQERDREEQNRKERQAREEFHKAITAAQAEARTWRGRYDRALSTDNTCAAWSQETVPCPL